MAKDVGLLGLELVFPKRFIRQADLAAADGVEAAKYEVGLGQSEMAFCGDREDVASLCLTALSALLKRHDLAPSALGFLEVGTETLTDKSKSLKTQLMELWAGEEGLEAFSLEGLTCLNACFGGTQALFHALNWLGSPSWDGRLAAVVMGDIATYGEVRTRPTGGAAAMALLLGPNAPIVFHPRRRALHCGHAWDFYKPRSDSEYPTLDSGATLSTYTNALDSVYQLYKAKEEKETKEEVSLESFQAICFHCPFAKLVQKSLARLAFHDYRAGRLSSTDPVLLKRRSEPLSASVGDRELEVALRNLSEETFRVKTLPSLLFAKRLGNCYTPSLYTGLAGWLASSSSASSLEGSRVLLFSFGSGFASAMFSAQVVPGHREALEKLRAAALEAAQRLDERRAADYAEYAASRLERESFLAASTPPTPPKGSVDSDHLFPGSFYLSHRDEAFRRFYQRFE